MRLSTQIQNNDFVQFKEEIYRKLRLLENKFSSDFNSKISNVNSNYDKLDLKIKVNSQNINSLLDMVSKQNFDFQKINQFEDFKNKIDETFASQQVQYKSLLHEISNMKDKYDTIIEKNLFVPGFIGPGAIYKSLSDYLIIQMEEFNKIRNQSEQNKKKVNDWEKNVLSIISKSLFRFQTFINNKNKQMVVDFEKRYDIYNTKILAVETELEKYQFKIDKILKNFENEINEIIQKSKDDNENIENKFIEIEQKINSLIADFESFKNLNIKEFHQISADKNTTSDNNIYFMKKKFGEIKDKNKSLNAINRDDEHKNRSINNHHSQIIYNLGSPNRKTSYTQLSNKEVNKFPRLTNKLSDDQTNKESNKSNNNLDNPELVEKRNDNHKISDFKKFNISINSRNSGNKRKNDKSTNIENQNSTSKINDLRKYKKEYDISIKKNESINEGMVKINIDGLLNGLKGSENKRDKNNEKIVIQSIMSSSSTEINKIKSKQNNINHDLNKRDYINLKSFTSQKNYTTRNINKNMKNIKSGFQMNTNIDNNDLMSKIREYYENKRKYNEKKSTEKMVNCNVINLNLRELSKDKRGSSQSSPRNTFYSVNFQKINNDSNFGKTSYHFFSKKGRNIRSRSLNSSGNKKKVQNKLYLLHIIINI